ncbi:MAG: hypothetical protein KG029_00445, partial [Bacteroidetes bacterium]|nr:hypothetical protein [Bacteroidota bacterium]
MKALRYFPVWLSFLGLTVIFSCKSKEPVPPADDWQYLASKNGLINNNVNDLAFDSEENLWIATEFGVSKFDGANWTNYNTPQGLIHHQVNALAIDRNNKVWFAT